MGIFRRMGSAIARFMYGRNGMDQLNMALFWGYLLVCVVRAVVVGTTESGSLGLVFDLMLFLLMLVIFFRIFSRNVYKRQGENSRWMGVWSGVRGKWAGSKSRHADKDHKYFTCKNCHTICRVPVGKGKVVITCPKCKAEIHGKT